MTKSFSELAMSQLSSSSSQSIDMMGSRLPEVGRVIDSPAQSSIWRLVSPHVPPIIVMHDGEVDLNVYCIHSVTGDVGGLSGFAAHFGNLKLHGVQVPKKDMGAYLAASIETIASRHVKSILAYQPFGPIHIIGWSAGAIIGLEIARQLREIGRDIPLLVALDGAPCNTGAGLRAADPRYALALIRNLPRWLRDDRASDWTVRGILKRVSEKLAAHRGARTFRNVETVDGDAIDDILDRPGWSPSQKNFVFAIYSAMQKYRPVPYPGRVLAFETLTQPLFHLRQIGTAWRKIASDLEIVRVEGNHSGLIRHPVDAFLAREIIGRLDHTCRPVD